MTFRDRLAFYETVFWFTVIAISIPIVIAYVLTLTGCGPRPPLQGQESTRPQTAQHVQP